MNTNLNIFVEDFIDYLFIYETKLKKFHWNSKSKSEHLELDDIIDSVMDMKDSIAELYLSVNKNFQFNINRNADISINVQSVGELVEQLIDDILAFKNNIENTHYEERTGITDLITASLNEISKNVYLLRMK